jgi:hypothetical protein
MPAGTEVTVPEPVPEVETVRPNCRRVNAAVTIRLADIVTTQVPVPVQAPVQPLNTESGDAAAVRVTMVPNGKDMAQVAPQLMPAGDEATVPVPLPTLLTTSVKLSSWKSAFTVASFITVNAHAPSPAQVPPLQPPNSDPGDGVGVSVTAVP